MIEPGIDATGGCEGKVGYASPAEAHRALNRRRTRRYKHGDRRYSKAHVYRCERCHRWHIGHRALV